MFTPSVIEYEPFTRFTLLPSVRSPRFVKVRFGGPKFSGIVDGPSIPSNRAVSSLPAKKGIVSLRSRLKRNRRSFTMRGRNVHDHPASMV